MRYQDNPTWRMVEHGKIELQLEINITVRALKTEGLLLTSQLIGESILKVLTEKHNELVALQLKVEDKINLRN